MTSGGGGSQNTTTTSSAPPPEVLANYRGLTSAANALASEPIPQYAGPLVAGFTPQQQDAFQTIDNSQGIGSPYINSAAQEFGQATTPLWPTLPQMAPGSAQVLFGQGTGGLNFGTASADNAENIASTIPGVVAPAIAAGTNYDVGRFESPYTKSVTDALTSLFNNQNQQQQQQIQGNATARGAYGGDREAVAQALAVQQQQMAQAPVLANVRQQGFQQAQTESERQQQLALSGGQLGLGARNAALQGYIGGGGLGLQAGQGYLGEFNNQQQQQLAAEQANAWLNSQAGFGLAGLGTQAQNQALTGANAQLQAGGLQQKLAQEQINIPYQQFIQQIASPYQQLQFAAGIDLGTGSQMGGTSSTTQPGPSMLGQLAGLGTAAVGGFGTLRDAFGNTNTGLPASEGFGTVGLTGADFGQAKDGGRIGYAPGGGIGADDGGFGKYMALDIPDLDVNFLPSTKSSAGNSLMTALNTNTQTQTGGGGGGGDGGIGSIIGLGAKAASLFLAKDGGRTGYDDGGAIGLTPLTLPAVPQINLDKLIPGGPGPTVKGSGPPKPPQPQKQQDQGIDIKGLTGAIGKTFGSTKSDTTSSTGGDYENYAAGGGAYTPIQGSSPNTQNLYGQYADMPLEQLQELAVRIPPSTQQGQLVQRALQAKRVAPQSPAQSGMGSPGLGSPAIPTAPGAPPATGGTSHLASGGDTERGYVTPDELDPHPIVDHSGETVVIRYPSEGGKVLDLGLPSIKGMEDSPQHFAAGGSTGSSPMFSFIRSPNGVDLPQLGSQIFAGAGKGGNPPMEPGGGLGNWFVPMEQWHPPGTTTDPTTGALKFPNTPGARSAFSVAAPAAALPAFGSGAGGAGGSSVPVAPFGPNDFVSSPVISAGEKRGGSVGHFDDGGTISPDAAGMAAAYEPFARPFTDPMSGEIMAVPRGGTLDYGLGLPQGSKPYEERKPMVTGGKDFLTDIQDRIKSAAPVMPSSAAHTFAPALTPAPEAPADQGMEDYRPTQEQKTAAQTDLVSAPVFDRPKFQGDANLSGEPGGIGLADFRSNYPAQAAPLSGRGDPEIALSPAIPATGVPLYGPKGEPWTPPPGDTSETNPAWQRNEFGESGTPVAGGPQPTSTMPGVNRGVSPEGPALVQTVIKTARDEAHLSDAALTGILANGLGEGGFNSPWQKAWGDEESYGHWQFYKNGELPGYNAFLAARNLPNDSRSQTLFVAKRMEEIYPGFSKITDPKLATDLVATKFERYKGAAPGQRYGFIQNAEQIMAGDYSGGLGPRGHGEGSGRRSPEEESGIGGPDTDRAPQGGIGAPQVNRAIERVAATAPRDAHGNRDWTKSPWFPILAAGLGMMASKSPFPGVAIGEGGLQGIKAAETIAGLNNKSEIADVRRQAQVENADIKRAASEHKIAQDVANLEFKYKALDDISKHRALTAEETHAKNQAMAEATALRGQLAVGAEERKKERDRLKALTEGKVVIDDATGNYVRLGAEGPVDTGIKAQQKLTGERAILHDLVESGAATDTPSAIRLHAELKRDPSSHPEAYSRLITAKENYIKGTMAGISMTPAQIAAQAKTAVDKDLAAGAARTAPGASPAPAPAAARPAAPAITPSVQNLAPATTPAATAAPAMPAWVKGTTSAPDGHTIFTDGVGWFNADHTPYAASP